MHDTIQVFPQDGVKFLLSLGDMIRTILNDDVANEDSLINSHGEYLLFGRVCVRSHEGFGT